MHSGVMEWIKTRARLQQAKARPTQRRRVVRHRGQSVLRRVPRRARLGGVQEAQEREAQCDSEEGAKAGAATAGLVPVHQVESPPAGGIPTTCPFG